MSGPDEFGPYLVYEELGSGAMASVHRAETRGAAGFRKAIALKRLHPQLAANEELVQAFVYEARLASHLKHGNIVQTFDFGKVNDTYFIAMELARGPTLKQVIRQCVSAAGAMPLPIAIGVVIQICDALDHAHNLVDDTGKPLGIVHRDVSPSNVIIDSSGIVKLIDFGIAKVKSRNVQTQAGTIKGKFGYIAPEYLAGQIDHRADLFAVGVLTHELLTSRQLFTAQNEWETLSKVREMPIQPPSRWNPQVPMELDHIVLTALQRDPSLRWQNAGALRNALTGVLKEANEVVTDKRVADWVMWAFSQKPRNDDSAMVRLIDDLEPSVSVEIVKDGDASNPVEPRRTPEGKTVVLAAKEALEASQAPAPMLELVPARTTPAFEGTVELVPAPKPADGDPLALFPGLTRAHRESQPIPMGPMPRAPGRSRANDPAAERPVLGSASARLAAEDAAARMTDPPEEPTIPSGPSPVRGAHVSARMTAQPRPVSAKMPALEPPPSATMAAQEPPATRPAGSAQAPSSARMAAQPPPTPSRMAAQPPPSPTPSRMAAQPPPSPTPSRMAAQPPPSPTPSRMAAQPPPSPTPSRLAAEPAPTRMIVEPEARPASTRMRAEADPRAGVVKPVHGPQSSGVVLQHKLPVKRPRAPRRRRARWWLIILLVLVAGAATAGYYQFPQLRAWWLERVS